MVMELNRRFKSQLIFVSGLVVFFRNACQGYNDMFVVQAAKSYMGSTGARFFTGSLMTKHHDKDNVADKRGQIWGGAVFHL